MISENLKSSLRTLVEKIDSDNFKAVMSAYRVESSDLAEHKRPLMFQETLQFYLDLEAGKDERPVLDAEERAKGAAYTGAAVFTQLCLHCFSSLRSLDRAVTCTTFHRQEMLVRWLCVCAGEFREVPEVVVDVLWSVDHQYANLLPHCLGWKASLAQEIVALYLRKTLAAKHAWTNLSGLCTWGEWLLTLFHLHELKLRLKQQERAAVPAFVEKCAADGAFSMAMLLSALIEDWPLLQRVARDLPIDQKELYPMALLEFLNPRVPMDVLLEVTVALLEGSLTNVLRFKSWNFEMRELLRLASLCRETGKSKWLVFFNIHLDEWGLVETYAYWTPNTEIVDIVLVHAAMYQRWNTALLLLPRCSKAKDIHLLVFKLAINGCCSKVVGQLLPFVDLREINFEAVLNRLPLELPGPSSQEFDGELARHQRADFEKIIQLLIRQGISTHCREGAKALRNAILWRLPSVARLFLASGVVTRFEYLQTLDSDGVKEVLDNDTKLKQSLLDAVPQVHPSGVSGLRHLARLAVSHQLGYHAGRADRVQALPLPAPLKRLVTFDDLSQDGGPQV